ncbi:MAG: AAA family ATPase [Nitrospirota bacterium]|nr:AAA family ATPase [Nitrospirota bacterium]MDE3219072.1 AAA family ATPase [Nitrospirota bacterium]
MTTPLITAYQRAIEAGVPLLAITTPDPAMTIDSLVGVRPPALQDKPYAVLQWDVCNGVTLTATERSRLPGPHKSSPLQSQQALAALTPDAGGTAALKNLSQALTKFRDVPPDTIIFVHNAHRFLHDTAIVQGIWHLRDLFKADGRMLILLAPSLKLPVELVHDVIILDDPLPNRDQLEQILTTQYRNFQESLPGTETPKPETMTKAVDAVLGLSAFEAEQAISMSFTSKGLSVPNLWQQKYKAIEQTPGLKIYRGTERFIDIGGVTFIKSFLTKILRGRSKPCAIVFLDELEKSVAGSKSAHGDNTGVSQDIHKQLLEHMQNTDATGIIMLGPPGTSKSLISKAAGNEAGIPTLEFDLGGVKSANVGASEHNMRQALKVITTISNGSALYLATCNSIAAISPELRRRFRLGTFMFPLPTQEERAAIWKIYLEKYQLTDSTAPLSAHQWTGAEIRQCADIAWRLNIPLEEAAQYIVPVAVSAKAAIDDLYTVANGAYLCASYCGPFNKEYKEDKPSAPTGTRRMRMIQQKEAKA